MRLGRPKAAGRTLLSAGGDDGDGGESLHGPDISPLPGTADRYHVTACHGTGPSRGPEDDPGTSWSVRIDLMRRSDAPNTARSSPSRPAVAEDGERGAVKEPGAVCPDVHVGTSNVKPQGGAVPLFVCGAQTHPLVLLLLLLLLLRLLRLLLLLRLLRLRLRATVA